MAPFILPPGHPWNQRLQQPRNTRALKKPDHPPRAPLCAKSPPKWVTPPLTPLSQCHHGFQGGPFSCILLHGPGRGKEWNWVVDVQGGGGGERGRLTLPTPAGWGCNSAPSPGTAVPRVALPPARHIPQSLLPSSAITSLAPPSGASLSPCPH